MSYHQQGNNERNENKDIKGQCCPSKVVEFVSKSTLEPLVGLFLIWYEEILVFFRAIAVSLDPLFFYVPVIKEDKKCIGLNKVLWIIAIVSRSVADTIYLVYFVVKSKIRNDELDTIRVKGRRSSWSYFVLNILVILPIPQVVMSSIFSEMRCTKSSNITILNSVILLQYGPRVFEIYRSWMKLLSAKKSNKASLWIKASLNLFLYILAGHVVGAFWYFFSTQRLTACWHKAFENRTTDGFELSFNCGHSSGNLSFLDDFCPIDSPNTSTFNFGIFLEARRSGILESTGFLQKVFYCFWWGMRNLSSFGSNLQTSRYIWENIFALGISISGLLLFLYFMGNLQVYMQDSASESIKKSDVGNLLIKLEKLYYKQRASESIENSETVKNPALDDAVVDKLETELRQIYKQCIASKSRKDAVLQKSDVGNLLIKLGEIYKQPASKSIEKSETDENPALDDAVVEKLGKELGQLYKQCKDAVKQKSEAASTKIGWCCC